jgi:mitochondrial fission protein ELM1
MQAMALDERLHRVKCDPGTAPLRCTGDVTCWAATTGEAGMVSQATGVAQAISPGFGLKTVPRLPLRWRFMPAHWTARLRQPVDISAPGPLQRWPDLLISCGKHSVPSAIALKRASGGRVFTVHIQDPRVPPHFFDIVAPPEHDGLTGANVFPTMGALHHVTAEAIAEGAKRFRARFATLGRPLIAALFGGRSRAYDLTPRRTRDLAGQLTAAAAAHKAGLIVSTSRRTGPECTAALRDALQGTGAMLWDGTGENPYLGMLALADWFVVTEDSASMMSEACFTGKPVYVARLTGHSRRFDRMHRSFEAK